MEEIELEDDSFMITAPMEEFHNVQMKLQEMGLEPDSADLQRIPNDTIELTVEQSVQIMKIIEEFEDDDDVQSVWHNLEVSDEVNAALDSLIADPLINQADTEYAHANNDACHGAVCPM